jgi:hypothetical protein
VVAGAVAVAVRGPDKVLLPADLDSALIGDEDRLDLAMLEIPEASTLPDVPVAIVNRDVVTGGMVEDCWAVGYPSFQEVTRDGSGRSVRETAQVKGRIPPLSGLVKDLLSLEVTATPRELPAKGMRLGESEWSGMSGAAVFAGEALLGVVAEHAPRRGSSDITVTPLDRLAAPATAPADAATWWARLGVQDSARLPRLPAVATRPASEGAARSAMRRAAVARSRELIEKLPLVSFGVALATQSRPRDVSVFKDTIRATIRAAIKEILRLEYPAGKFVDLDYRGRHPQAPESWTGVVANDNFSWFISVHPQQQTTGVYALGRADWWIPPLDSGPEEFIHWVRVARDVAVAAELALGTPEGSPCYIAISKVRISAGRLPKRDAYATVVDDRGLRYAEPGWTAWLRSELGLLLPEFE